MKVKRRLERVAVNRRRTFAPLAREESSLLRAQALRFADIEVEERVPCHQAMTLCED